MKLNMFKDKKLNRIFLIIGIGIFLLAFLDLAFMKSGLFGNIITYTNGEFPIQLWYLYEKIAFVLIFLLSGLYYMFRKDFSESLAIGAGITLGWFIFSFEDILYFWLNGFAVPQTLPWLNNNILVPHIAKLLGSSIVTNTAVFANAILGMFIIYFVVKYLTEKM